MTVREFCDLWNECKSFGEFLTRSRLTASVANARATRYRDRGRHLKYWRHKRLQTPGDILRWTQNARK